jgi:hypothetical protein
MFAMHIPVIHSEVFTTNWWSSRIVFEDDTEAFLCLFHVMKAWLESLRRKLTNKSRFREDFEALKSIVYWNKLGASDEKKRSRINHVINNFREAFKAEGSLLHYFTSFWEPTKGRSSCTCHMHTVRCNTRLLSDETLLVHVL